MGASLLALAKSIYYWISNKNISSQNISNALKNVIQTSQTVGKLLVEKASMIDFGSKI